jgi:beta-glucosidase
MPTAFTDAAARVAAGADPHVEARALVALMTDAEKLGCLDGDAPLWPGLFDMTAGGYYRHSWPAAVVERLGVPGLHFADGPRGCVVGDATAFPVSMARGATFDPDLEERIGEAIGAELRASGATFTGAVCMNLLRHPAWGRAQETYGEDPHHVGAMAAAFTRGLQRHVMACMKHFALNSMENARFSVDVTVDERPLHEVYLPHFRRVAREGVAAVMSAYNSVNGEWCGQNQTLLTEILRDEWEWDGVVISDFIFGLRDAVASVRAGLDIEMPFRQQRAMRLPDAIAAGEISMADVEAAVERTVATLLRFAWVHDRAPSTDVVGSEVHRRLAREAAVASMVLLRNEGDLLPVAVPARVAVLGRLAAVRNLGDGGSSDVKSSRVVTPLDGLVAVYGDERVVHDDTDVAVVDGADVVVVVVGFTKDDEGEFVDDQGTRPLIAELFAPMDDPELGTGAAWDPPAGFTPGVVGDDERMAPGGDRASLRLSAADEALIAAAADRHDRVVVVVQGGSAVVMPWADSVAAVLVSWYSGVEGGSALADVISGAREPRGRLPFAIPVDDTHLVDFDRHANEVVYDLFHGQWKLDRDGVVAHFPFGQGLGYGTADVRRASLAGDGTSLLVTLGGDRATSAVVFVFAGVEASAHERPERRLVGFRRAEIDDDGARTGVEVEVPIDWSALDLRLDGQWVTEPGRYVLEVGLRAHDPLAVTMVVDRRVAGSSIDHTG